MSDGPTADTLRCAANEIGNLVRDLNTCIGRRHWAEAEAMLDEIGLVAGRAELDAGVLNDEQVAELRAKHGGNP